MIRLLIHVAHSDTPLWQRQGWTFDGSTYRGVFRTRHGAWPGELELAWDGLRCFITNPPPQLFERHGRCMVKRGKCRYWIHIHGTPNDPDSAIAGIQRLLDETLS